MLATPRAALPCPRTRPSSIEYRSGSTNTFSISPPPSISPSHGRHPAQPSDQKPRTSPNAITRSSSRLAKPFTGGSGGSRNRKPLGNSLPALLPIVPALLLSDSLIRAPSRSPNPGRQSRFHFSLPRHPQLSHLESLVKCRRNSSCDLITPLWPHKDPLPVRFRPLTAPRKRCKDLAC